MLYVCILCNVQCAITESETVAMCNCDTEYVADLCQRWRWWLASQRKMIGSALSSHPHQPCNLHCTMYYTPIAHNATFYQLYGTIYDTFLHHQVVSVTQDAHYGTK